MPPLRRILIVSNALSGRGQGVRVVAAAVAHLRREGFLVHELPVDRADPAAFRARFRAALAHADALVLAGGDGTVHHALPVAASAGVPVFHMPLGTENLFSRECGSCCDLHRLARTLRRGESRLVDMGSVTGGDVDAPTHFALMCSIGPDAGVIRRLHATRRGAITHLSYLRPTWDELLDPALPLLTVEADGKVLVRRTRGMLIIANSRHYGGRLNPACDARADDGLLDLVFFPADTGPGAALWMARSLLGAHTTHPAAVCARARAVKVETADGNLPHQMDGELGHHQTSQLTIAVAPRSLRVLTPAD